MKLGPLPSEPTLISDIRYAHHQTHYASWVFNSALGELRGVFGIHIARLAAQHGLDVEDELAAILPNVDESAED